MQSIKAYKRALVTNMAYIEPASSFGSGASDLTNVFLDPELLYPIALLHEKVSDMEEAASYMELVLAQEEGPVNPDLPDDEAEEGQGSGVTVTTSKARMWLAKRAFGRGELSRAMELANELCQDGYEVEEAKALVRDLRARMEAREK